MWYFRIVSEQMEDHMELNHISHSKAKFYPKVLALKLYLERLDFKPDCTNIACFEANHETMCSFVLMLVLMLNICINTRWMWDLAKLNKRVLLNFTFKGHTWTRLTTVYTMFTHNITPIYISRITTDDIFYETPPIHVSISLTNSIDAKKEVNFPLARPFHMNWSSE